MGQGAYVLCVWSVLLNPEAVRFKWIYFALLCDSLCCYNE